METNLLPTSEKKFLKTEKLFRVYVVAAIILILGLVTTSGFLYAMTMLTQIHEESVNDQIVSLQAAVKESETGQVNQKITDLNKDINFLERSLTEQTAFHPIQAKFLEVVPFGVRLNEMSGVAEDATLTISGIAATREDLLLFENALEEKEFFKKVEAPLSNIVTKENVPFDIVIEIKESEIYPNK